VPIAVIVGVITFLEWLVPQLMDFHTLTRQAVQFQSEARDIRQKDEARVEQLVRDIQGLRDQITAAGSNRDREVATTLEKRITDLEVQLRLLQDRAIEEQRNQGEQKPK
jgi:hypothetical protein